MLNRVQTFVKFSAAWDRIRNAPFFQECQKILYLSPRYDYDRQALPFSDITALVVKGTRTLITHLSGGLIQKHYRDSNQINILCEGKVAKNRDVSFCLLRQAWLLKLYHDELAKLCVSVDFLFKFPADSWNISSLPALWKHLSLAMVQNDTWNHILHPLWVNESWCAVGEGLIPVQLHKCVVFPSWRQVEG